MNTISDTQKSK